MLRFDFAAASVDVPGHENNTDKIAEGCVRFSQCSHRQFVQTMVSGRLPSLAPTHLREVGGGRLPGEASSICYQS